MSIIDDVLITIDDDSKTKEDLEYIYPKVKTSTLFSALGRLVGKKLIKEEGKGKLKTYVITNNGADIVEGSLNYLRSLADQKNMQWVLVSLSIPEKYKVERERIRLTLKDWGFGLVKNGLFIGQTNNIKDFNKQLTVIKKNANLLVFPINTLPEEIALNPSRYWPINKIKSGYEKWAKHTNQFIKSLPKNEDIRRVYAKSLVYELASITRNDPKLSDNKFSSTIGREAALKLYRSIRDYCYR